MCGKFRNMDEESVLHEKFYRISKNLQKRLTRLTHYCITKL